MWPLTKNKPKQLIELAGKPMLDYVIDSLDNLDFDRIIVSVNSFFAPQFQEYLSSNSKDKKIELFIEESNKYWGDNEEYKFNCVIDTISDASEMTVEDERFIRSTFSVATKAYLLPEYMNSVVTNKKATLIKELTPRKIVFENEIIINND